MLVDYNSESRIFFVVTDSYETVNVPYLLLDRDKKGDVFNENPDSYGYKIFYKRNYKENDIFQVIESDLDKRIGWIFPISSIVSTSHDYADNPHYCRYALVAHMLLLRNEIAEQDIVSRDFSSIIESEYSDDAIILIYKKDLSVRQAEKLAKKKPEVEEDTQPERKPSFYSMVELALNESLGRKIKVNKNKGKQGGVLQIEFYSDEELTELSNKLK